MYTLVNCTVLDSHVLILSVVPVILSRRLLYQQADFLQKLRIVEHISTSWDSVTWTVLRHPHPRVLTLTFEYTWIFKREFKTNVDAGLRSTRTKVIALFNSRGQFQDHWRGCNQSLLLLTQLHFKNQPAQGFFFGVFSSRCRKILSPRRCRFCKLQNHL